MTSNAVKGVAGRNMTAAPIGQPASSRRGEKKNKKKKGVLSRVERKASVGSIVAWRNGLIVAGDSQRSVGSQARLST